MYFSFFLQWYLLAIYSLIQLIGDSLWGNFNGRWCLYLCILPTMKKKPAPPTIRSSAAEYLTFVAATGDAPQSIEMRYEDENI